MNLLAACLRLQRSVPVPLRGLITKPCSTTSHGGGGGGGKGPGFSCCSTLRNQPSTAPLPLAQAILCLALRNHAFLSPPRATREPSHFPLKRPRCLMPLVARNPLLSRTPPHPPRSRRVKCSVDSFRTP